MDELKPIPQEPVQVLEPAKNKKAIWSVIIGLSFNIIFGLNFISAKYPNFIDLQKNDVLALLIWAPFFIMMTISFVPIIIFLLIIIRRMKGIKEKTENFNWSLLALILNTIALILILATLLSTGKCIPGAPCF